MGVARRFEASPIDVEGVAQGLKGVEADAHGQDQPQRAQARVETEGRQEGTEALDPEVQVFEGAEQPEIGEQARGQPSLCGVRAALAWAIRWPATKSHRARGRR